MSDGQILIGDGMLALTKMYKTPGTKALVNRSLRVLSYEDTTLADHYMTEAKSDPKAFYGFVQGTQRLNHFSRIRISLLTKLRGYEVIKHA